MGRCRSSSGSCLGDHEILPGFQACNPLLQGVDLGAEFLDRFAMLAFKEETSINRANQPRQIAQPHP